MCPSGLQKPQPGPRPGPCMTPSGHLSPGRGEGKGEEGGREAGEGVEGIRKRGAQALAQAQAQARRLFLGRQPLPTASGFRPPSPVPSPRPAAHPPSSARGLRVRPGQEAPTPTGSQTPLRP